MPDTQTERNTHWSQVRWYIRTVWKTKDDDKTCTDRKSARHANRNKKRDNGYERQTERLTAKTVSHTGIQRQSVRREERQTDRQTDEVRGGKWKSRGRRHAKNEVDLSVTSCQPRRLTNVYHLSIHYAKVGRLRGENMRGAFLEVFFFQRKFYVWLRLCGPECV